MANQTGPPPRGQILLLDDDENTRALADGALRQAGFAVLAARTADEALRTFQRPGLDVRLVLADVNLGGEMDGLQTMALLRQLYPDLPFCLLAGQGGGHTLSELLALDPEHIFLKPFPMAKLIAAVSRILRPVSSEAS